MTSVASLHKILKDDNRQKILLTLNERGSLSYTDLIEKMGFVSTGLLNYHLKVLGDLLSKNEKDHYVLTEKGRLALKFLEEFPEQETLKRKKQKQYWRVFGLIQVVIFVVVLVLYSQNYVDSTRLIRGTVTLICMIFLTCLGYKLQTSSPLTLEGEKKRFALVYIIGGGLGGFIIAFFGTPIVNMISAYVGGPDLFVVYVVSVVVIGCLVGYWVGKKKGFRQPKWAKRLEDRLSFLNF